MRTPALRSLALALLLLATLAFAIGVGIEKAEAGEHSGASGGHAEETLLGVETESTPLIVAGIVLSLIVALAVWRFGRRVDVLVAASAFCLGFAVLDGIEMARKWGDEATIAVLASLAMLLHAAAAVLLAVTASRLARPRPASQP
ncbi:MAG: hypothetical protein AB7V62_01170 [Thermoleophilia bacterium]